MGSSCPPHWTFAARAAYFGDAMCTSCAHRNPAGAKFCNECASPLPEGTPSDVSVAATVWQPPLAASSLPTRGHSPGPGRFFVASIITILIVAADEAHRTNVATPHAIEVAARPTENNATVAARAMPLAEPVESERTAGFQASLPARADESPKPANVHQRTVPVLTAKRASAVPRTGAVPPKKDATAHQRPGLQGHAPPHATSPVARGVAAAPLTTRAAQTTKATPAKWWQLMHVSLAECSGDLIARFMCDQRLRRHFCEGHWGETPECASGVANEHGQ